jgi:hypothetical protein
MNKSICCCYMTIKVELLQACTCDVKADNSKFATLYALFGILTSWQTFPVITYHCICHALTVYGVMAMVVTTVKIATDTGFLALMLQGECCMVLFNLCNIMLYNFSGMFILLHIMRASPFW